MWLWLSFLGEFDCDCLLIVALCGLVLVADCGGMLALCVWLLLMSLD